MSPFFVQNAQEVMVLVCLYLCNLFEVSENLLRHKIRYLEGMKTKSLSLSVYRNARMVLAASAVFAASVQFSAADIPDRTPRSFEGMYKIAASSDPLFPMESSQEWFLDFGKGISDKKLSGSVAVSLRENPNVRVRIMAWQYFPERNSLLIGNPYSEGSTKAVARGVWQLESTGSGVVFQRGNYKVVLRPADPGDY